VQVSDGQVGGDELDATMVAVRAAMRVCRSVAASSASVRKLTKSDDSPVTVADFASQAVVVHLLRQRLGPIELVGEESADALRAPDRAALREAVTEAVRVAWPEATEQTVLAAIDAGHGRNPGPSYWTLDPIDGTKGFLRGGQYAVSLARVEDGEVVLGLLGCPSLGLDLSRPLTHSDPLGTLHVGQGDSTCVYSGDSEAGAPVSCSPDERPDPVIVTHSVESGHTRQDDIRRILEHVGWSWRSLPADSQAKYAMVARGQAHVYMRIPGDPTRMEPVWDHAAGVAVARGAGAVVTDLAGRRLDFSQGVALRANHGIICAHPSLQAALVRATVELGLAPKA
jgi:3'(2'), 5'-bisphosphate nucleotidase